MIEGPSIDWYKQSASDQMIKEQSSSCMKASNMDLLIVSSIQIVTRYTIQVLQSVPFIPFNNFGSRLSLPNFMPQTVIMKRYFTWQMGVDQIVAT